MKTKEELLEEINKRKRHIELAEQRLRSERDMMNRYGDEMMIATNKEIIANCEKELSKFR